jgi:hypothetical protein
MGMRNPHQPPEREVTKADQFNILFAVITAMACLGWPFTRCGFGTGAFHPFAYIACVIMFCYAGFGDCPQAMLLFFLAWLTLVIYHRVCTLGRAWRGDYGHSMYDGCPWLIMNLFGLKDDYQLAAKAFGEPAVVLVAAGVISAFSPPLALFLVAVAACIAVRVAILHLVELAFERTQRDADLTLRLRAKRRRREW